MTPDAFSRAVSGQRGFAAIELARLADVLGADVHCLITGEKDPNRLQIAARHNYDPESGRRDVPDADADRRILEDVALAYHQAESADLEATTLPATAMEAREWLGPGLVRQFIDRLEVCGIDVVRLPSLSTSYCFTVADRAVIIVRGIGSWFRENWSLAHELGHLAQGHMDRTLGSGDRDRHEAAANAFAAELLLPEDEMHSLTWDNISASDLANRVWDLGVSTEALVNRLNSLQIKVSSEVAEWSAQPTQRLLRRHWTEHGEPNPPANDGTRGLIDDPIPGGWTRPPPAVSRSRFRKPISR